VDPLSDVLRAVRLTGAHFYRVEAAAPWSVFAHPARQQHPRILPQADHVIPYHILTEGECWGGLRGGPPVRLGSGDVIVFPHGDAHTMESEIGGLPSIEQTEAPARFPDTLRLGAPDRTDARFVCGFLGCDLRPFNPLLSALPRLLHLPGFATGWLAEFPRQVVEESERSRVGAESMLSRMAELMFVECLRRHLETTPEARAGWLGALADPLVGRAIQLLHARPTQGWTLPDLAREAMTSRSVLAERFTEAVGMPPMQYLTLWRLQLAAERLAGSDAKVSAIGAEVGYESEAAFSRAFKRTTGLAPAQWRTAKRAGQVVPGPAA
jgi:AraC-like DNA-binding protein